MTLQVHLVTVNAIPAAIKYVVYYDNYVDVRHLYIYANLPLYVIEFTKYRYTARLT